MATNTPGVRPANPCFSSGPCAKRPGWSPTALNDAALGRSHRAKIGKTKLKLAIDLTREVLGVPASTTRVPGAKAWIRGLANVRGQLLPIVDLRQFLGSGVTPVTRNTRVLVVNHREIPAGLLVDEVLGFRRFAESEFSGDAPPTVARCERYLAGAFRRAQEQWPVLSLRTVLESAAFADAAA